MLTLNFRIIPQKFLGRITNLITQLSNGIRNYHINKGCIKCLASNVVVIWNCQWTGYLRFFSIPMEFHKYIITHNSNMIWFFNIQVSPLSMSYHGRTMKVAVVKSTRIMTYLILVLLSSQTCLFHKAWG